MMSTRRFRAFRRLHGPRVLVGWSLLLLPSALCPTPATAQEIEPAGSTQRGGTVLFGGVRVKAGSEGQIQLEAGGGHTTNVNAALGFAQVTARPAKFATVFVSYVYVGTAAAPGPATQLHLIRSGAELTYDIGRFQIANRAALEYLYRANSDDLRRARNRLQIHYTLPQPADAVDLKLFTSGELVFAMGEGLRTDRITAGVRATIDRTLELSLSYLGDRRHGRDASGGRIGYAVPQLTYVL